MRATTDEDLETMSHSDIAARLNLVNEMKNGQSVEGMRKQVKDMERTRNLLIWHDLSTVANHSHLVFVVSCLYDPAAFYTDAEFEQLKGRRINVQAKVESPSVYIVARSSSSDKEQLAYVETRLECLEDFSNPVTCSAGIEFKDTMRFIHGHSCTAVRVRTTKRRELLQRYLWGEGRSCI